MFVVTIADQVATILMHSPPVNSLSEPWLAEFLRILDHLSDRDDWKVLHLRSDQKAFCAGADLKEMRKRFDAIDGADRTYAFVASVQRLYTRIETMPQVTLAEIGGAALGGGFELALSCDLRVAAAEAKIGLPEVKLGLIPGAGGTQRLTRLVGRGLANRLILTAESVDGTTAERLGLVQWSCPCAQLPERAADIARHVASLPGGALAAAKLCIAAAGVSGRGGFSDEIEATYRLQTEPETRARVSAFLAGTRPDDEQRTGEQNAVC